MKKTVLVLLLSSIYHTAYASSAWNTGAKYINALSFTDKGLVQFTLFNSGNSGVEFKCSGTKLWFEIKECNPAGAACLAATNRMASMVLAAKVSGKKLLVFRTECNVSSTALAPN